jgi:hypothetical protein
VFFAVQHRHTDRQTHTHTKVMNRLTTGACRGFSTNNVGAGGYVWGKQVPWGRPRLGARGLEEGEGTDSLALSLALARALSLSRTFVFDFLALSRSLSLL